MTVDVAVFVYTTFGISQTYKMRLGEGNVRSSVLSEKGTGNTNDVYKINGSVGASCICGCSDAGTMETDTDPKNYENLD